MPFNKLNQIKKIAFVGDSHADWDSLYTACEVSQNLNCDLVIQVGDFGWWPKELPRLPKFPLPLAFIDGNHEHFEDLFSRVISTQDINYFEEYNIYYIPRGSVLNIGGTLFGFMGGGASIDRNHRIPGVSWFQQEIPTYAEYNKLFSSEEIIEFMVTHDCPEYGIQHHKLIPHSESQTNREVLDLLSKNLNPNKWVHGHYHFRNYCNDRNCELVGLECAPDLIVYDCLTKTFNH